jgi:hypothetical protein
MLVTQRLFRSVSEGLVCNSEVRGSGFAEFRFGLEKALGRSLVRVDDGGVQDAARVWNIWVS